MRLFEGIDGRRTIAEIAARAAQRDRDRARPLFQRLWWYDQLVFDASAVIRGTALARPSWYP